MWTNPLGLKCSPEQLAANKANGKAAENYIYDALKKNPNVTVLGKQVYVRTADGGRYIDILFPNNKTGKIIALEVKSGNAVRSSSQIAKDKIIRSGKGTFGNKAPDRLGGKETSDILTSERRVTLEELAK